ncbi:hypothetical protein D9M71_829140 [compost metagenome]
MSTLIDSAAGESVNGEPTTCSVARLAAASASSRACILPTDLRLLPLMVNALPTRRVSISNMISPTTRVAPC